MVTKGSSDDANGQVIAEDTFWLRLWPIGYVQVLHYSRDGRLSNMVRLFRFPAGNTDELPATSIGFSSQAPVGRSYETTFGDMRYRVNLTVDPRDAT